MDGTTPDEPDIFDTEMIVTVDGIPYVTAKPVPETRSILPPALLAGISPPSPPSPFYWAAARSFSGRP